MATVSLWLPGRDCEQCYDGQQLKGQKQHAQGRVGFKGSGIADRRGYGDGNRKRG